MLELFRQCDIFFHFIIGYEKNPAELQLLKKYGCEFEPQSGKTNVHKIGVYCYSAASRSESKV
jgi:hypothetical protein